MIYLAYVFCLAGIALALILFLISFRDFIFEGSKLSAEYSLTKSEIEYLIASLNAQLWDESGQLSPKAASEIERLLLKLERRVGHSAGDAHTLQMDLRIIAEGKG